MLNKFKIKIRNEILALSALIIITIFFTSYYNYTKNKINNNYKEIISNVYFKKTTNHFLNNLEPKYKKIRHQIKEGETFDNILSEYAVNKKEIVNIKKKLSEKINLNKLNITQKIYLTIDQSNSSIKDFIFQISNKERVLLTRNEEENSFDKEILLTKLDKKLSIKKILFFKVYINLPLTKKYLQIQLLILLEFMDFKLTFNEILERRTVFKLCMKFLLMRIKK